MADESVLEPVADKDMLPGLVDLDELGSWRLFLRDRGTAPEPAAGPREGARDGGLWVVWARLRGRVGEGSREAKGEGATDDARETEDADVAEVWEVSLEGHESVLGLTVAAELEVDSRDSVGPVESGFDDGAAAGVCVCAWLCACACCWPVLFAWVGAVRFCGFAGDVVGNVVWTAVGSWDRLGGDGDVAVVDVDVMFGDLSMFALTAPGGRLLGGRGRPTATTTTTEGMETVSDHTCQT